MKAKKVNEGIDDVLKPKSQDEIQKIATSGNVSAVYHVWSGVDAFEIKIGDKYIYMPYIAVIAKSPEKAREKAALIGQKLEDNETNHNYNNYISHAEFKYIF